MDPGDGSDVHLSWLVVCHESARDLGLLLPSLRRALERLARTGLVSELIVVDNASSDGSASLARRLAPEARVVRSPENLGYGAAVNRAAGLARGDWLAVGNADLFVPAGALDGLPALLDRAPPDVALLGPALHGPDGRPARSAGRFPTLASLLAGLARPCHRRKYLPARRHRPGPVEWVTGACLFARRDAFTAVGGFDPAYFLYYEDVDLARRLLLHGHRTLYAPEVALVHVRPHHGRPPQAAIERHVRASRRAWFARHRPGWENAVLELLTRVEPLVRRRSRATGDGAAPLPRPSSAPRGSLGSSPLAARRNVS